MKFAQEKTASYIKLLYYVVIVVVTEAVGAKLLTTRVIGALVGTVEH